MLLASQAQLEQFRAAAVAWLAVLDPAPADEDVHVRDTNSSLVATVWVNSETQQDDVVSRLSDDGLADAIDEAVSGLVLSTPVTTTWQIAMPGHPPSSPPPIYPSPSSPSTTLLDGSSPAAPPQISTPPCSPPPQPPLPAAPSALSLDSASNNVSQGSERDLGWFVIAAVAAVSTGFAVAALIIIYRRLRKTVSPPKRVAVLACSNASTATLPPMASALPVYMVTGTNAAPIEPSGKTTSAEDRQWRAFATRERTPAGEPASQIGVEDLCRQRKVSDYSDTGIPELKAQIVPEVKPSRRASAATTVLLQRMQSDSQNLEETAAGRFGGNGSDVKQAALRHIEQAMLSMDYDEADSPSRFDEEDLDETDALDEMSLKV